jgi:hypothetical protein
MAASYGWGVTHVGSRRWYLKYRQLNGKENRLSFGAYPDVSLAGAREKRVAARKLPAEGIDPAAVRDAQGRAATKKRGKTRSTRLLACGTRL